MWLLDHNLPVKLKPTLKNLGVACATTKERGWDRLQNGELVSTSFAAGFRCILTRDVRFGEAALPSLKQFTAMAVVLIRLPQRRGQLYIQTFSEAWKQSPIVPAPGKLIEWPG